jgi:hypothetical protein
MWITLGSWILQKGLPYILGAVMVLVAWRHVNKWLEKHYNPQTNYTTERIVGIDSSTELKVRLGLKRTRNVMLYGIEVAPAQEQQAKDENSKYVSIGDTIRVEVIGGRLLGGGDVSGVVLAPNGTTLQLNLLRLGLAKNSCDRKDFVGAQLEAQKSGVGIWHIDKPVKPHRIPWFDDEEENGN